MSEARAGDALCGIYLAACEALMQRLHAEEAPALDRAACRIAEQIAADRLVHIYGPGGHSNLAAQEVFYRPGAPMHLSPILDGGTLLSNGALRSTAMERLPGYGALVIETAGLAAGDLLLLVNAFGVNAAAIDAAMAARARGVFVIGLSSRAAAEALPADHPARHPSGANLHDLVDVAIDTKVPSGDAAVAFDGRPGSVGPIATLANGFALNLVMLRVTATLAARGFAPVLWRSRNAAGDNGSQAAMVERMRGRVACL